MNKEEIKTNDPVDIVDEKNIKNFFIRFLKGILIGIGAILPRPFRWGFSCNIWNI